MRGTLIRALLLAAIGAWSCQAPLPAPRPGYAWCAPCVEAGDLACLEVRMDDPDARSFELDGVTHWFCSEECRDEWLAAGGGEAQASPAH